MKTLKISTLIAVCISILYLAVTALLSQTELSLRTWAAVLGQMVLALLTPLLFMILLLALLYQREHVHRAIKGVCTVGAVILYGYWAFLACVFILFGMQEERMLTRKLLVTDEGGFPIESKLVYYRPTAFFFKMPGELTDEDKVEYLIKKYKKPFAVHESGDGIYCTECPDVEIKVYLSGMMFDDDYEEGMALKYLLEGYESLGLERGYYETKTYTGGRGCLCMKFDGEADIPAVAQDISQMIAYVLEHTDFFEEHLGTVRYSCDEDEKGYLGNIPFGGYGRTGRTRIMSRTDAEGIEELIRIEYQREVAYQREDTADDEPEHISERRSKIIPFVYESDARGDEYASDIPTDYREEAAKIVYDAVLAEQGYSYEVCYNAKGNLYIDLGSKTSNDGRTYDYRLVYDRTSKNGKCELFVLYRSAGGDSDEVIEDMYAVETGTGEVVASGKKTWSDVGTEEYRELTGE